MDNLGRSQRLALRVAGVVAVLSFVVALPLILNAGFHADDFLLFPREAEHWGSAVVRYLASHDPEAVHYYRPGCRIVQQTIQATFGTNGVIFHAWSVLLHLAATFVLYRLARSLSGDNIVAGMAAILFLIHPAHDEPLMWMTGISGLTDSLFHLIGLLAFDSYLKDNRRVYCWLVPISFLIALSHKESATSMLLTLPLLWWYRGHNYDRVWPIAAVAVLTAVMTIWRSVIGIDSSFAWQNLTFNPLAWIRTTMYYLLQFLVPVRTFFRAVGFDNYYAWRNAMPIVPNGVLYGIGIAMVGVLSSFLVYRLWGCLAREARLALGLAFLAIAPLLLSRYTGLRLLYLSSAFLALAVAVIVKSRLQKPTIAWVFVAWIVVMSASYVERATAWNEAGVMTESILREAVRVRKHTPDNTASVYLDVPRRHIGAFLFPRAFAEAVRWRMRMEPSLVFDYGDPYTDRQVIPTSRLWFRWNGERFDEVTEPMP